MTRKRLAFQLCFLLVPVLFLAYQTYRLEQSVKELRKSFNEVSQETEEVLEVTDGFKTREY